MNNKIKKNQNQQKYILKNLTNITTCSLDKEDLLKNEFKRISAHVVKDIITNNFNNGPDMNSVVCFFDTIFLATTEIKKKGLYYLPKSIQKWILKMEKLDVSSSAGYIYITDILDDLKVVIKRPKYPENMADLIVEYFVGVKEINKLRYIVPNFMYTFGAFICPITSTEVICNQLQIGPQSGSQGSQGSGVEMETNIPFLITENIPGNTLEKLLSGNYINFSEFLGIFIQLLIGLEVAQKTLDFSHFDLHCSNILCRPVAINECNYIVPLNIYSYNISVGQYIPVIIDFGVATASSNNVVIGSYDFPKYGMMNYMVPGADMYKLLINCCYYSKGHTQKQIVNLLNFYEDEPYNVLKEGKKALVKALNEYVSKGSFINKIATYTPLDFLDWIFLNYPTISRIYVKKVDRNVYIPLSFTTTVEKYYNIYQEHKEGKQKAIKLLKNSIKYKYSYILSTYYIYVLEGYNKNLKSSDISYMVEKIKIILFEQKDYLIKKDLINLNEYEKLKIPNIKRLKNDSKKLLNIGIKSKSTKIIQLIDRYTKNIVFFEDILPYLQFVYTIKEIGLKNVFRKFLKTFFMSIQYQTYLQEYILVNRTSRWCKTLLQKEAF
jgi:hypothetical protein